VLDDDNQVSLIAKQWNLWDVAGSCRAMIWSLLDNDLTFSEHRETLDVGTEAKHWWYIMTKNYTCLQQYAIEKTIIDSYILTN